MFRGLLPTQEHLRTLNQWPLGHLIARATVYRSAALLDLHFVLAFTFEVFMSLNAGSKYRDNLQLYAETRSLTILRNSICTRAIMYCSHCCSVVLQVYDVISIIIRTAFDCVRNLHTFFLS